MRLLPWLVVASAVVSAACGPTRRPPRTRMSVKEIAVRSKPAIVRIEARVGEAEQVGTGFAIDPSGIIATNLHVVAGSSDIKVTLFDGHAYQVQRVVGVDPDRDLTLLSIDVEEPMPYLKLGDSDILSAGDPVVAIGNPLGVLDYTVSDGLISSVRVVSDQLTVLQTSAPISQGSSGGPLINPYGEVIGVATAIFTGGQNLNIAVPSKYLMPMLAAPRPMSVVEFAAATAAPPPEHRPIPLHDVAVLDGCSDEQATEIAASIAEAIQLGAPLYNAGNYAACFKIYEGTAVQYERDAACAGVRQAFSDGLARAKSVESATDKAWALRDTFDGLLNVIVLRKNGGVAPPP